jgi:RNA polymerase sigma-70 factor (ECF subfamily)
MTRSSPWAYLPGGPAPGPYAEAGKRLGMSEGAIKVAVHRLRKHYREVLRDEVAQTLGDKENVDQELRNLMSVL